MQFLLRAKKIKNYNPSNTYINEEKKENESFEESKNVETFEFKSIPKEIEEKYNYNNNENQNEKKNFLEDNNHLFYELKDFMKIDKDNVNENKIKIKKENESNKIGEEQKQKDKKDEEDKPKDNNIKNKDNQKNRKYSNNRNSPKNKFDIPLNINNVNNMNINNINNKNVNINPITNMNMNNIIYYNNYLDFQKMKTMQYIQFHNHINKTIGIYNLNNNNKQINKFNQMPNKVNKDIMKNDNINNNNNINNNQINDKNININNIIINNDNQNNNNNLNYFKNNNLTERQDIEAIMSDIDYFFNKNENKRGWKVVDKNNIFVNKFNNEQLFFFLNTINSREGDKNFSISDIDDDILFNPLDIYEHLKKKYQK